VGEPLDEPSRQLRSSHLLLRFRDIVREAPPARRPTIGVDQQTRRARIVVARLSDAARVQNEPPARALERQLGLADDPVYLDLTVWRA
jgi:hypothetical protein